MRIRIIATALAFAATITTAQASVVFSDDFNGEPQALNTTLSQWNITVGTIDVIGTGFYDFYPGNGNYLDLDGSTGQSGTIETMSSFGAGNYALSFALGGSARGDTNTVSVFLGATLVDTLTLLSSDPLTTYSYNVTTTGGALTFAQTNPGDNMGLILDDVVLSDADIQTNGVPEPATLALFGAGLAGLSAFASRRRLLVKA